MTAILKSKVRLRHAVDAYLREELSCQISSRFDLRRESFGLFFEEVAQEEEQQQQDEWRYEISSWFKISFTCEIFQKFYSVVVYLIIQSANADSICPWLG